MDQIVTLPIDTGNTAFILIATALVMIMTPGLAFFYGGLVGRKNVLTIMMQSFIAMGVVTLLWFLVGFSLSFGTDVGGVIGGLEYAFMTGVGMDPHSVYGSTVPFLAFFAFQMMFAVITPALITGSFTDRMKFSSYLVFLVLWSLLVYSPLAHWVWGGGFISKLGAIDFAGGTVVHISAGFAALAAVVALGKRKKEDRPHNLAYVALGTALLWFGWYGFNAGSALTAGSQAATAFVNTDIAASAAMIMWPLLSCLIDRRPSMVGALTGVLAGLVAITPAAGYVPSWAALVIGLAGALVSFFAVKFRIRTKLDDALDVWGVHGMAGVVGSLLTGVFASEAVGGFAGWIDGNFSLFISNLWGTLISVVFAFVATYLILKLILLFKSARISEREVEEGLDRALHGEEAYDF